MTDYYQKNYREYFNKTFTLDSSFYLLPFVKILRPGSTVLDVGCGSGRDLLWLKNRGYQVMGFERSRELAALARKNSGCSVIEDDFQTFEFSNLSMDAIIMSGSLVHTPHEKLEKILGRIKQALVPKSHMVGNGDRPEGIVYISVKEGDGFLEDQDGRFFYLWKDDSLRKIFFQEGFTVLNFMRGYSADGKGKMWLGYVLKMV